MNSSASAAPEETVIEPTHGLHFIPWRELHRYRDLLWLLVWRDFVARYKQTVLGPLWFVIQPLLATLVFTVVFGKFAGISTAGVPPTLFYLAGLLGWNYFAQTFQSTSATLIANAPLFGKIYFPRLIVPLSAVISNLVMFGIQLGLFFTVWGLCGLQAAATTPKLHLALCWLPLIVTHIAALSLGTGLWLAALTTRFRDFSVLATFALQLWLYATPIIYPLAQVPARWQMLVALNPMTAPIELMRHSLLGTAMPPGGINAVSIALTAVLLISGLLAFQRVEKSFIDQA